MDLMEHDDLTDLRQRELEESKRAWRRIWRKKAITIDPDTPEVNFTICSMEPEKLSKPTYVRPVRERNDDTINISTNIGIPEKKRGWERADRQYHGWSSDSD